jgi:hypothetical protein
MCVRGGLIIQLTIGIFAGNLGDLEESSPTLGRPPCTELYAQAIQVAEREYGNRHVYPYLYSVGAYLSSLHLLYRTGIKCSLIQNLSWY